MTRLIFPWVFQENVISKKVVSERWYKDSSRKFSSKCFDPGFSFFSLLMAVRISTCFLSYMLKPGLRYAYSGQFVYC